MKANNKIGWAEAVAVRPERGVHAASTCELNGALVPDLTLPVIRTVMQREGRAPRTTSLRHRVFRAAIIYAALATLSAFGDSFTNVGWLQMYVAPTGNDTNLGNNIAAPVATLAGAQTRVRQYRTSFGLPTNGVTVWIRGGLYFPTNTLALTATDSGTPTAPVVFRAYTNEQPIFSGGQSISPLLFQPLTNFPALTNRVKSSALPSVVVATSSGTIWTNYFPGKGNYGLLSWDSYLLQLAQWPNKGFNHISTILDPGCSTRWTPVDQLPPYDENNPIGGLFTMREAFDSASWSNELARTKDMWAEGFPAVDWLLERQQVASVSNAVVKFTYCTRYGVSTSGLAIPRREHFINVLYELDQMGEWYFDRTDNRLYLWPIAPLTTNVTLTAVGGNTFVSLTDAQNITLRGLVFENSGNTLLTMTRGISNLVAGCTFRNSAGMGATISSGTNNGIASCDFYGLDRAFTISGGDQYNLIPCNHFADNNHIYNCRFTGYGMVSLSGCGIRFSHNLMHDMNGALQHGGVNFTIEYNEFYNMGYEMSDWNICYGGALWQSWGVNIRYNFVHHLMEMPQAYPVGGFRNDDLGMGHNYYGNVFYKSGRYGVSFSGAGNRLENSIAMEMSELWYTQTNPITPANVALQWQEIVKFDTNAPGYTRGDKGDYVWRLEQVIGYQGWNNNPYLTAYPLLKASIFGQNVPPPYPASVPYAGNPWAQSFCALSNNYLNDAIAIECHYASSGTLASLRSYFPTNFTGNEPATISTNSFVNPSVLNFATTNFTPMPGFTIIPVDQIGLYTNSDRPSPPNKDAYRTAIRQKFDGIASTGGTYDPNTINYRYPDPPYLTNAVVTSQFGAGVISINFMGRYSSASGQAQTDSLLWNVGASYHQPAGITMNSNVWNDFTGQGTINSTVGLIGTLGQTATLHCIASGSWGVSNNLTGASDNIMSGGLIDNGAFSTPSLTNIVTGLAKAFANGYKVIVYLNTQGGGTGSGWLTANGTDVRTIGTGMVLTWAGSFVELVGATPTNTGNYVVFGPYTNDTLAVVGGRTSSTTAFLINALEIVGQPPPPSQVLVETLPDGSGGVLGAISFATGSGDTVTVFAIVRDANGGFLFATNANWSLTNLSGSMFGGSLTTLSDNRSATFTAMFPGSAKIHATVGTLNPVDSGVLVVTTNASPSSLGATVNNGQLTMTWPTTHLGWILEAQTNALNTGINPATNGWFDIPGSGAGNGWNVPINPANPTTFFRLRQP